MPLQFQSGIKGLDDSQRPTNLQLSWEGSRSWLLVLARDSSGGGGCSNSGRVDALSHKKQRQAGKSSIGISSALFLSGLLLEGTVHSGDLSPQIILVGKHVS